MTRIKVVVSAGAGRRRTVVHSIKDILCGCDVSNEDAVRRAVARARQKMGGLRGQHVALAAADVCVLREKLTAKRADAKANRAFALCAVITEVLHALGEGTEPANGPPAAVDYEALLAPTEEGR